MEEYKRKILVLIDATDFKVLTFRQLQKAFLLAIKDFKQENIYLEQLSSFASFLWVSPTEKDSVAQEELQKTIQDCAEISFYLRKIPESDKDGQATIRYILSTLSYYEQNKHILE